MNKLQLVAKFAALSGTNVLSSLASFGATILIVSAFGTEGLGRVSLVLSVLAYAALVGGSGIEMYTVREVAAARKSADDMISNVVVLRLMTAAVVYLAVVVLALSLENFRKDLDLFLVFGLTLLLVPLRTTWIAQAQQQAHVIGVFNLLLELGYLAGVVAISIFSSQILTLGWARFGAELLATLVILYWVLIRYRVSFTPVDFVEIRRMLREAWPFTLFPLVRGLSLGLDLVILSFFVTEFELGLYAGASKIFFTLVSFTGAYVAIIYPWLSSIAGSGPAAIRREIRRLQGFVLPAALVGSCLFMWQSQLILVTLFGAEFSDATPVLQLLTVAFVAGLFSRHYRQILLITNKQEADLKVSLASMVSHLALKILLVAQFGMFGAALGMAVGEVLLLLSYLVVSARLEEEPGTP